MKKTLVISLAGLMLAIGFTGNAGAKDKGGSQQFVPNNAQVEENFLPDNAKEVAPGVFYIGEEVDKKGNILKGYTFVHYAEGYESEALDKDLGASEVSDCYNFVFGSPMKWAAGEQYIVSIPEDSGFTEDQVQRIRNIFEASISTWENAVVVDVDIIGDNGYTTEKINKRKIDGINSVRFGALRSGVIAVNTIWTDGVNLVEWDQVFSTKFDWSLDGEAGKMDLQNIATHELGHAVGLGDLYTSECSEQTMYGYSSTGETYKRDLGYGDITGINELYY